MARVFIEVEIATDTGFFHVCLEPPHGGNRNEFVLRSEENDGGWRVFRDVVCGGELLVPVAAASVPPFTFAVVEDGVEKQEGGGFRRYFQIIGGVVGAIDEGGKGGEVTACGATCGGDAFGINAESGGMGAHPAHRGFRITAGVNRRAGNVFDETIFREDADEA